MPADRGAWRVLGHECLDEAGGRDPRKASGGLAYGQEKIRDRAGGVQLLLGEVVAPAEGNDPALADVPLKLELPERQVAHVREQRLLVCARDQVEREPEAGGTAFLCTEQVGLRVGHHGAERAGGARRRRGRRPNAWSPPPTRSRRAPSSRRPRPWRADAARSRC